MGVANRIASFDVTASSPFSESITLTGDADVLVVALRRQDLEFTANVVTFDDGGTYDTEMTLVAYKYDEVAGVEQVQLWAMDVSAVPAGTYTIDDSDVCNSVGADVYELLAVTGATPEATATAWSTSTTLSGTIDSVTNGGVGVALGGTNASTSMTAATGDLDAASLNDFTGGVRTAGSASMADTGTIGTKDWGFTTSGGTRFVGVIAIWTSSGEVVPVDIDVTFDGPHDNTEIRLFEIDHPASWDCYTTDLIPSTAEEKVVTWDAWYTGILVQHRMWTNITGGSSTNPISETAWQASTSYDVDDLVQNGDDVYICTDDGTSAASGGPTGYGTGIEDNTCEWAHVYRIHQADIGGGDDDEDIATEWAATIAAADGIASAAVDTTLLTQIFVQHLNDGQISIPTTDAAALIDVWLIGNELDEGDVGYITGIEDTSGGVYVATVTVGSPRLIEYRVHHAGEWEHVHNPTYRVARVDATVPVQQRRDRNYVD